MRKYILFGGLLCLCVVACNNQSKIKFDELSLNIDSLREDSIKNAEFTRINDSLKSNDKGYIVDSIHLGMSKNDFMKVYDRLKEELDYKIRINEVFLNFYSNNMDFGEDNRLHVFKLERSYTVDMQLGNKSNIRVNDPGDEYIKNLKSYLVEKYGQPIKSDRKGKDAELYSEIYLWNFTTRRIELLKSFGKISLLISDPIYYNRQKEIRDSIENVINEKNQEIVDKQKNIGNQI